MEDKKAQHFTSDRLTENPGLDVYLVTTEYSVLTPEYQVLTTTLCLCCSVLTNQSLAVRMHLYAKFDIMKSIHFSLLGFHFRWGGGSQYLRGH